MRKAVVWGGAILVAVFALKIALDKYVVYLGRQAVKERLTDPDSAAFRNEQIMGSSLAAFSGVLVCGQVNVKNQAGGYVGFKEYYSFVSISQSLEFMSEVARDQLSADHVRDMCSAAESRK